MLVEIKVEHAGFCLFGSGIKGANLHEIYQVSIIFFWGGVKQKS